MTTAETPLIEAPDLADDALYAHVPDTLEDDDTDVIPAQTGPPPPSDDAPYGWMEDKTAPGGWRAKKSPGRPKGSRTPAELATAPPVDRAPDKVPATPKPPAAEVPPMPAGGVIAKGVNKLYRRAGKVTRAWDADVGNAVIACTKPDPDDPDSITVGEAWENLCKTNERVRAIVLKAIAGGIISDLAMAHLPIGLAIVTKPAIQRWIPFMRIAESLATDDDGDDGDDPGGDLGGLTPEDIRAMNELNEDQAAQMAARMARGMGAGNVPPGVVKAAMAEAQRRGAAPPGGGVPAGFRRQQPKNQNRSHRKRGR